MKIKIGELARKTDCQVVTIRYYEKEGLLGRPERSEGNYRLYGEKDVERLKFIRHCRRHGMMLGEIRHLLEYRDKPKEDCAWVCKLIDTHVSDLDVQIQSLMQLKACLRDLRTKCSYDSAAGSCGIVKSLADSALCCCSKESHPQDLVGE